MSILVPLKSSNLFPVYQALDMTIKTEKFTSKCMKFITPAPTLWPYEWLKHVCV